MANELFIIKKYQTNNSLCKDMNMYKSIIIIIIKYLSVFCIFLISISLCSLALIMGASALAIQTSSQTPIIEIVFTNVFGCFCLIYPLIVLISIFSVIYCIIKYKIIKWKFLFLPIVYFVGYVVIAFTLVVIYSFLN